MPRDFLLMISDKEPLAWILSEGLMAFPAHRSREAGTLAEGDRLFLYTTRHCFHNPARDPGRVIGEATVASSVSTLEQPVEFGDRVFPLGCSLVIAGLTLRDEGPVMGELVARMHLFAGPNSRPWGMWLRRVLAPLDRHDASLLHRRLAGVMRPVAEVRQGYLAKTSFAVPANGRP